MRLRRDDAVARPLDFLVIGAQRSGTTTLWRYLSSHPGLFLPRVKEAPFFSEDWYDRGYAWWFQTALEDPPRDRLLGTVTPQYMSGWSGTPPDVTARRVCMSHREWRSICGHARSPTHLITVKPHLEFSSFGEALSLVVPTATMLLSKRMISLEDSEVT